MNKDSQGLLSDLDIQQIIGLVEALDRSSFDSLQLDVGRFRLTLGKGADLAEPAPPAQVNSTPAPISRTAPTPVQNHPSPAAPAPGAQVRAKQPSNPADPDLIDVRSPIMGLFYSRPDPGSPPFVSLGTEVGEGTTVGLVEVMKVFNAVQAGAKGVIAEICVEDAQTIEIGQTLFRIRRNAA